MKIYLRDKHSEFEGATRTEGLVGQIHGNRQELLHLCSFFRKVEKHLIQNPESPLHAHLRDHVVGWDHDQIDIEVNLES